MSQRYEIFQLAKFSIIYNSLVEFNINTKALKIKNVLENEFVIFCT